MKFPSIPCRACRRPDLAIAAFITAFTIGCASPGPPRPPSLKLPRLVNDLSAQRIGNEVELHWTTPAKTTDDLDIEGPITAEICRESWKSSQPSTAHTAQRTICVPIKELYLHPGLSHTTDVLPADLTMDPLSLLAYRIQVFNSNARSAGHSSSAFTLAGSAPPPMDQLRVTPTRFGTRIEWHPSTTVFPIELDRVLLSLPSSTKSSPKPKTTQSFNLTTAEPVEVHLQAGNQASDPGGTMDRTAQPGETYSYTVQRIRRATLAGHTLEMRSIPSPAITVFMRDTIPPASPTGLAAIPAGTGSTNRSIDLSWEPDSDPGIIGYIVYRQAMNSSGAITGEPTRLNPTPIVGPAFSDHTAVPGQRYAYYVTAIDTFGNQSAPSPRIEEILTEP